VISCSVFGIELNNEENKVLSVFLFRFCSMETEEEKVFCFCY
jgi:hypothetical protein